MDFEHLLEPYAERDEEGIALRTVQGQIGWLVNKKQIDVNIAQLALAKVYFELSGGRTFTATETHSAGYQLDHYLLITAIELKGAALNAMVKSAGDTLEQMINKAIVEGKRALRVKHVDETPEPSKVPWWKWNGRFV